MPPKGVLRASAHNWRPANSYPPVYVPFSIYILQPFLMSFRSLQVAQFSAELENYQPAIQVYEDVARLSMDNNLLKYSAKGYLLNAGICRLCGEATLMSLYKISQGEAHVWHLGAP